MRDLRSTVLTTSFVVLGLAGPAQAAAPATPNTQWYVIVDNEGVQLGYASKETVHTASGTQTTDYQEILIGDQTGPRTVSRLAWTTVLNVDAAGRATSISSRSQVGKASSLITARIEGDRAVVTRETPAGKSTATVTLPPDVRFDEGDVPLMSWDPDTTPRLTFDNFNIDAMAVEKVAVERVHDAPADPQGRNVVLRKRYSGTELVGIARLVLDRGGNVAEATIPMFGKSIVIRATTRAEAMQSFSPYGVFPNVVMKSPFRIPAPATLGHIRYRFGFKDGMAFDIPQTGEQRVTLANGEATVDICVTCGPGLATDAATLADARRPTEWLQSDAARIREIAEPVAKLPISDSEKMERLRLLAKPYLGKVDFVGHFSALETLSRKSADCTEAAVLLAALGRAAGIPTRVVNGVVYSQVRYHGVSNAFMPHSWTLAYADGKWRSFDLALDTFDATHVALTVGDGDERSVLAGRQLSGLLRWDDMSEVRTPATN